MHSLRTDTELIPVLEGELHLPDTEPMAAPWLLPPIKSTYRRPSRWRTFRRSVFVAHVAAFGRGLWLAVVVVAVAVWFVLMLRGAAFLAMTLGVAP